MVKRRAKSILAEEQRALRLLTRALRRFERVDDPQRVGEVAGEPEWVARLAPFSRAFVRLLLEEAERSPVRPRRRRARKKAPTTAL